MSEANSKPSACSTPECDALARDPFDSNDMSAWHSLAYRLEKKLTALQSETALSQGYGPDATVQARPEAPARTGGGSPQRDDKKGDVGPWVVRRDETRQWRVCSENFKHDVELIITGDFKDEAETVEYAADIARRLSAPQSAVAPITDEWRAAALRLGEQLTTTGPNGYYSMTPTQWLDWCENALPSAMARTDAEVEEIARQVVGKHAMHLVMAMKRPDDEGYNGANLVALCQIFYRALNNATDRSSAKL